MGYYDKSSNEKKVNVNLRFIDLSKTKMIHNHYIKVYEEKQQGNNHPEIS